MIILFSSCFLAYITAIYYVINKIEKDAFDMGFTVNREIIFKKILTFQNVEDEITLLIPLIPIINILYAYKILNIYLKYKNYIYQEFRVEKIFIEEEVKNEVYLENVVENLLKELDERECTVDDLIFLKKALDVLKIKYINRENIDKINQFESKLLEIVIESDKQKRLQK